MVHWSLFNVICFQFLWGVIEKVSEVKCLQVIQDTDVCTLLRTAMQECMVRHINSTCKGIFVP